MPLPLAPASLHPPGRGHADAAAEGFGSPAALAAASGGSSDAAAALKVCKEADAMHKVVGAPSKACKTTDLSLEDIAKTASGIRNRHFLGRRE
uniref:Uncharacterized protein n=1 Tax=Oryza meridionalis TaxID=40149 RepID=A0A0E0E0G4_9ORYZ